MAQTIKGGAYQTADGRWLDANGKPLSSSQVQQFQALQQEKSQDVAAAEASMSVTTVTPFVPPVAPAAEDTAKKTTRRGRQASE